MSDGQGGEARGEAAEPGLRRWLEHVGIVLAVVPALVAAIRLNLVGRGDPALTATLVRSLDLGDLLLATYAHLVPTVLFVLALIAFLYLLHAKAGGYQRLNLLVATLVALVSTIALMTPVDAALAVVACVAVAIASWYLARAGRPVDVRAFATFAVTAVLVAAIIRLFSTPMWIPAEVVEIAGEDTVVGYVVEAGGEWTTVLAYRGWSVRHVPTEKVTGRTACNTRDKLFLDSDYGSRPALHILLGREAPGTRICPSR
jgi:hypothetical protein